jgi:molybdopterin-binding protein
MVSSRPGLTVAFGHDRISLEMTRSPKSSPVEDSSEELLKPREAALELRISFPTIKQWIYKRKIRSIQTAGGHHRIPQSEIDRLLFRTRAKTAPERALLMRRLSGRNQLVGRIESVRVSGLMAEVVLSIGEQQITSIITARSAREMNLKAGQTAAALMKSTEVMILRI